MSSVASYVRDIKGNWRRCVDAFINVGRLCAEANARLTAGEKSELMPSLPFGAATFSKFVQIGTDTRLHAPDFQRLLPAHYTTVYHISLLTDEELKQAIADNVLHPDMTREQLLRWPNSHRQKAVAALGPNEAQSLSAVASLPIPPTQDAVENGALPSLMEHNRDDRELSVVPDEAPAPEAVATAAVATSPPIDDDIPAFLDRRPLSADDQRAFDMIMAALNSASALVRARVERN
jgi:hypothetical protein